MPLPSWRTRAARHGDRVLRRVEVASTCSRRTRGQKFWSRCLQPAPIGAVMRVPTGDHVARSVASVNRRVWLAEVMQKKLERFDCLYAPTYDQEWGAIPQTHRRFVRRIIESAPERGSILDAACGTGRFFPMILESGRTLRGAEWSVGMLDIARAKHPDVRIDCAR